MSFKAIADLINQNGAFTIISHTSPDGDTLGSSLALYIALKALGKTAEVVCDYPVPHIYAFLPCCEDYKTPDTAQGYETAISVDCADMGRLGESAKLFLAAKRTASIDHHPTNTGFADINVVDGDAAAAGELIFTLVCALLHKSANLPLDIAECIYTALMTDTGCFAYSNTAPSTFYTAAKLRECGVDTCKINRLVYRTVPYEKQKLLGLALSKAELFCSGKAAYACILKRDIEQVGASEEATEGIIDHLRDIKGVEAAVLARGVDEANTTFKVSLRSKQIVDVGKISASLGGGGHRFAAGYTSQAGQAETEAVIKALIKASLGE